MVFFSVSIPKHLHGLEILNLFINNEFFSMMD